MADRANVLIVCSHNAARSQMAEAILKHIAGDRFNVYSAGIDPNETIHPLTRQVIGELNIDLGEQHPKSVEAHLGYVQVHYMLILSSLASKATPTVWPGALGRFIWPFADPAEIHGSDQEQLDAFRMVRDQIHRKMKEFASYDHKQLRNMAEQSTRDMSAS